MTEASQSVETQLGIISTKIDMLLIRDNDHEGRLRKLEQFKWLLLGAGAAAGGGAGALINQLLGS